MPVSNKKLIETITNAVRNKKGTRIVIADFSKIKNVVYRYFVICQGGSATQVEAITREIGDRTRDDLKLKPLSAAGLENCTWVALDYGDVIVHIFQPEAREFYDLEHLWEDARLQTLPDED